jgi:hypothetical protein
LGFGVAAFTRFASEGWWACLDSNQEPDRYERPALTIELQAPPVMPLSRQATVLETPYNAAGDPAMPRSAMRRLFRRWLRWYLNSSLPGLTRQSIVFERLLRRLMDTRVKPA